MGEVGIGMPEPVSDDGGVELEVEEHPTGGYVAEVVSRPFC